ncbi:MAG: heme-binding protein [Methylococcales bacterium]|nr:heme-binding protein [Methylococcales bacterium]
MKFQLKQMISRSFSVKVIVCLLVGWSASGIAKPPQQGGLTGADCDAIIAAARADASGQDADFRAGDAPPKYHYACVDRTGKIVSFASDEDAWEGSRDVAKAKAFTAMAFSSDQNALTTRTIFCATQPGGPLWELGNANQAGTPRGPGSINQLGIIQFPGGVPIYIGGKLVGGFGVSGDSIALDERTALAGTGTTYGALDVIKSSTVLGVSYQLSDFGGACSSG